eukprot:5641369-Heterocapsa_arctica.AAC.1
MQAKVKHCLATNVNKALETILKPEAASNKKNAYEKCFKRAPKVLQMCSKGDPKVIQKCSRSVPKVFKQ